MIRNICVSAPQPLIRMFGASRTVYIRNQPRRRNENTSAVLTPAIVIRAALKPTTLRCPTFHPTTTSHRLRLLTTGIAFILHTIFHVSFYRRASPRLRALSSATRAIPVLPDSSLDFDIALAHPHNANTIHRNLTNFLGIPACSCSCGHLQLRQHQG